MSVTTYPELLDRVHRGMAPDEREGDVVALIDLLTYYRALKRNELPAQERYVFSGQVLCLLTAPFKAPPYINRATAWRVGFRGVETSRLLQAHFFRSIKPFLIEVATAEEAVNNGFDSLFDETELEPAWLSEADQELLVPG